MERRTFLKLTLAATLATGYTFLPFNRNSSRQYRNGFQPTDITREEEKTTPTQALQSTSSQEAMKAWSMDSPLSELATEKGGYPQAVAHVAQLHWDNIVNFSGYFNSLQPDNALLERIRTDLHTQFTIGERADGATVRHNWILTPEAQVAITNDGFQNATGRTAIEIFLATTISRVRAEERSLLTALAKDTFYSGLAMYVKNEEGKIILNTAMINKTAVEVMANAIINKRGEESIIGVDDHSPATWVFSKLLHDAKLRFSWLYFPFHRSENNALMTYFSGIQGEGETRELAKQQSWMLLDEVLKQTELGQMDPQVALKVYKDLNQDIRKEHKV